MLGSVYPESRLQPDLEALSSRLRRLSSTVVSDVLDRAGFPHQSLSAAIRPLAPGMKFAGLAACFSGVTVYGEASGVKSLSPFEIDRAAAEGVVIVIAMNGHTMSAAIGGLMCLALQKRGCAGVVVDGGARDVGEIVDLALPVFCRYATPLISAGRWALTGARAPIRVAGQASDTVEVAPDDFLIGDADGVVVIPRSIAADIVAWSENVAGIEETIAARLREGETREAMFAAHPRFAHIRRLRD
jgi:4-hydroxy-4-methyl-2-oxoglutarate aldolase